MNKIYKSILSVIVLSIISIQAKAQLAGTYSVPATFSTIAAAINSLNIAGVSGTVTILVNAGHTETVPVGGFSMTATGTAINPIIFQKNGVGANPLLIAYAGGTATPSSALQDGVWRFIGSDYVTIDGINISDPNTANPATMEFGYGFFKTPGLDGCQNNTIQNCVITLNRENNAAGTLPAVEGSRGIDVVNATSDAHTSVLTPTNPAGSNSNNRFYSNTIQNCNVGISLIGYADLSPFANADLNNDIGGNAVLTGNSILNFGGATAATNPAAGVRTAAQYSLNVSFNTINNNNGAGVSHVSTLRGILIGAALSANSTINNNTVTVKSGATTSALTAIDNSSGSTAAANLISINNNLITNCTYTTSTSGVFIGILSSASTASLSISSNSFINNSTNATSGTNFLVSNTGAVTSAININSTTVNGFTFAAANTGTLVYISNTSGSNTASLSISSNSFEAISHSSISTTGHFFIRNSATTLSQDINNNRFINLLLNTSGSVAFMSNDVALPIGGFLNANNNAIVTGFNKTGAGGTVTIYLTTGSPSSVSGTTKTEQNNNFSNITLTGATTMAGWMDMEGAPGPTKLIVSNTFTNWACGSNAVTVIQTNWSGNNTSISSNTISNISGSGAITGISRGISGGASGTEIVSNNIITGFNSIAPGGAINGITGGATGITTYSVFNNTIGSFSTVGASVINGISVSSVGSSRIYKNKIYDLQSNNALGTVNGINMVSGTTHNIFNNLIGDLKAPIANAVNAVNGIFISGGTTYNIYYNSVYLNASSTSTLFGSSAIFASTTPAVNLRNNIFNNSSVPNGTASSVAYRRSSITLTSYSTTSNRNIFYAGNPGPNNLIFFDGTNANQTLGAFQTLVGPTRDAQSQTENSPFLSIIGTNSTFLHVDPTSPSLAESGAANIATFTDDFDNDIRQGNVGYTGSGTAPDIGADEFNSNVVNCNLVGPAVVTPTSVLKCDAQTATLSASGYTTGAGITQQWQVSTNQGGPYSNVVGGIGGNYPLLYTTSTLSPNTYYYVLLTTCTISGQTAISNEATVTVLPYPTLTVTPATSTICVPGGASVNLAATGALSYTWSPANGLSGIVGSTVNALPGATTVYTVTGVNAAGCASVTTTTLTILEGPSVLDPTATPSIVCSGGNSNLSVYGALTNSYSISGITYSPIPTPTVGAITLCSNSVAVTPLSLGTLNDGAWSNLSIPFNFMFFGTAYNTMAIGTNGVIFLGSGNPNTVAAPAVAYPNAGLVRPSIAAVYGNLNWSNPGSITMFTTGVAPNRKVIVNWTNGQFSLNSGTVTTQAIIYETSNNIDVHTFVNSGNLFSIQGIQNGLGTVAYTTPNRNYLPWNAGVPDAYRWSPNDGPISYSWTPSTFLTGTNIPNPAANTVTSSITYSILMSSLNGCTNTAVLPLVADITPTVTIAGTNSICSSNTLNLTANGAVTYSWNTGAVTNTISGTPSVTTTYSVIGTTSLGCTGTAVKVVTVNTTPTVSVSGPSTSCSGSSVNMIATGAATYSWSNGSTLSVIAPSPTSSVVYTVIGTSTAGCASSVVSKTLTVYALPTVTITVRDRICIGEPVTIISSGTGVDTYSWNTGANSAVIIESPTVSSVYTVTVSNNNTGCSNTATASITVDPCVGLNELNSVISGLTLYPNPNNGAFTIELSNGKVKTIEISDISGRIIMNHSFTDDKMVVDLSELANGVYYVKTLSENAIQVNKIIKQ